MLGCKLDVRALLAWVGVDDARWTNLQVQNALNLRLKMSTRSSLQCPLNLQKVETKDFKFLPCWRSQSQVPGEPEQQALQDLRYTLQLK